MIGLAAACSHRDAVGVASYTVPRPSTRVRVPARELLVGLALVALVVAVAMAANAGAPQISTLLWAVGASVLIAPFVRRLPAGAGVAFAAKHLLRAGVALLGFRISLGELADVGVLGFAVAVAVIACTMAATLAAGRALGVPRELRLLVATGTAVCGASAIAAMASATGGDDDDIGYAILTVTIFGTAAMIVVPLASHALGLTDYQAGMWAGASIHEVAQATAAGAAVSATALKVAAIVKLCRVVLLAPLIMVMTLRGGSSTGRAKATVPGFLLAFCAFVLLRSVVSLPSFVLDATTLMSTLLLTAGLAAVGLRIRVSALRTAGPKPLALGLLAWAVAALVSLGLIVALG